MKKLTIILLLPILGILMTVGEARALTPTPTPTPICDVQCRARGFNLGGACSTALYSCQNGSFYKNPDWQDEDLCAMFPGLLPCCCRPSSFSNCTDSDGGANVYTKGTCIGTNGTHTDLGYWGEVYENFCQPDGKCSTEAIECPADYLMVNDACVPNTEWCNDTDGGDNWGVKGTCTDFAGVNETDSCYDQSTLSEWRCLDKRCFQEWPYYNYCSGCCVNGACTTTVPTCTDTDNDGSVDDQVYGDWYNQNLAVRGTATDSCGKTLTDTCEGTNRLQEAHCRTDGHVGVYSRECGTGQVCLDGRCSVLVTPTPCADSDGGHNYTTAGTCTDSSGSYADSCWPWFGVMDEYYCSGNSCQMGMHFCTSGQCCKDGACKATGVDNCVDNDGGKTLGVASTCQDLCHTQVDECLDLHNVLEWFCDTINLPRYMCNTTGYECPPGTCCKSGACKAANCPPGADLAITSVTTLGTKVNYTIKNQGTTTAGGSWSGLYIDGSTTRAANDGVGSLTAGQLSNESFTSYVWTCSGVSDSLRVCADYGSIVAESDENNNCKTVTVSCGGVLPTPTPTKKPTSTPTPTPTTGPTSLRIFVTDASFYEGNLGGLSGADAKCRAAASSLRPAGTFKAWLSDSVTDARDRFLTKNLPYYRLDVVKVANSFADLTDSRIQNPIIITEYLRSAPGVPRVWTGTNYNGTKNGSYNNFCKDWTTDSRYSSAVIGLVSLTTSGWTNDDTQVCGTDAYAEGHLYCVEDRPLPTATPSPTPTPTVNPLVTPSLTPVPGGAACTF